MNTSKIDIRNDDEELYSCIDFDDGEFEDIKQQAQKYCREFLGGAWKSLGPHDLVLKKVTGGLNNLLYYCSLPNTIKTVCTEPSRVLLRIYGPYHDDMSVMEAHFTECLVCAMLSEKEQGPRLHGVFPGGRLEEYIPARPLKTDELLDKEWSVLCAEAIAQLHTMTVPLSKEPNHLWSTMDRWLGQIERYMQGGDISPRNKEMVKTLTEMNLRLEVKWLQTFLASMESPVVFSHNDAQEGNILMKISNEGQKSVVLIDFEYCAYNYRGFDIANHFCETMYDYSNDAFPYFWSKPNNFPTKPQQGYGHARFAAYLEQKKKLLKY